MDDAKVERKHRITAVELVKVPRVHPLCVEQWVDGAALPAWAEGVFAQAVSVAQALANAEQTGRERERAAVVKEMVAFEKDTTRSLTEVNAVRIVKRRIERGEHTKDGG
jgi:hypothetical protein